MSARTITGTTKVQLSKYNGLDDLRGDDAKVFKVLQFADSNMSEYGYSVVGEATVTVTLYDNNKIVADKVMSLRAEAKKVKADAHAAVVRIESRISELLAITNEVQA